MGLGAALVAGGGAVMAPAVVVLVVASPLAVGGVASVLPTGASGAQVTGAAVAPPEEPAGLSGAASGEAVADIPPGMLALYRGGAAACPGLAWSVLAGIGKVETDHGRADRVSTAGAQGPMQFMPLTWSVYGADANGDGSADPWDPPDAVLAAARMLCADGASAPSGLWGAVWQYNHSSGYVAAVLSWARRYSGRG